MKPTLTLAVLDNDFRKVFAWGMNASTASDRIPDLETRAREITQRQLEEWFNWMDWILDVHRSHFVFRDAMPKELAEHELLLKSAIRKSNLIHALIADPDFSEPELVSRLQARVRQLQDAYDTFHDATLSDEQAGKILRQVFPE